MRAEGATLAWNQTHTSARRVSLKPLHQLHPVDPAACEAQSCQETRTPKLHLPETKTSLTPSRRTESLTQEDQSSPDSALLSGELRCRDPGATACTPGPPGGGVTCVNASGQEADAPAGRCPEDTQQTRGVSTEASPQSVSTETSPQMQGGDCGTGSGSEVGLFTLIRADLCPQPPPSQRTRPEADLRLHLRICSASDADAAHRPQQQHRLRAEPGPPPPPPPPASAMMKLSRPSRESDQSASFWRR